MHVVDFSESFFPLIKYVLASLYPVYVVTYIILLYNWFHSFTFVLPSASLLAFSCLWLTFLISFCRQLSCCTPSSFKIIILDYLLDDFHAFCLYSMISSVLLVGSCFSLYSFLYYTSDYAFVLWGNTKFTHFPTNCILGKIFNNQLGWRDLHYILEMCFLWITAYIIPITKISQFLLPVRQDILYYNKDYYWIFYLLCHVRFQKTDLITLCQMRWKHVAWSGVLNTCPFLSFLFREKVNLGHNFIKSYHVEEWALAHEVSWFSLYFSVTILTFKLPWGTRTWLISTMW